MISHPSRHCTVELQALPSRIGQVRRILSAQLRYWHLDPLIDRATLGVTELLANVHRHAQPDKTCTVEIELLLDRLTVSVRDHDPRMPVVADLDGVPHHEGVEDADTLATCGRGLAMVAAVSESWGVRPDGESGKVVWFTLPTPPAVRAGSARPPRRAVVEKPACTVDTVSLRRVEHAPARSAVAG
ncbi:ATP-binding protein [Streptomyces sp. YU58]|uniref:ATP-binding protein n=1 Tax=Streptomyces sp. SX92 TaxID=3158972 RepID=UPI0027B8D444|nr:ATP-binding protein [Streptomyces coralus]WLW57409.1 ATP-binding protein [Streptomyces coralus]